MTNNHSGRYLQNLGICFKQGNPAFEKRNPASTEGNPTSRREILLSEKGPFSEKTKTTGGPGRARIGPAGIFPTSAFLRRSGGHFPAEVGRRICPREASRRSGMHRKPALEAENPCRGRANPSQARIFPTSTNSRRSGKSLPSMNLPDLPMALLSQGSGIKPIYKGKSSYSGFSFPY